jgi:hypothetical protein
MISYHPLQNGTSSDYAQGFKVADVDDMPRLARGIVGFVWSPIVWANGRRRQEHFLRADLCVLDFDSPEMTLAEALRTFCDCAHIIGTTRNHQKEKHGIVCDRFRVALRFAHPITDLRSYLYSLRSVVARYPADPAPKDGARFFFPCHKIVSIEPEGYVENVVTPPPIAVERRRRRLQVHRYERWGHMPPSVERFLKTGELVARGRNHSAYYAARTLAELGEDPDTVRAMVLAAPYPREGLAPGEIEKAIENGIAAAGAN